MLMPPVPQELPVAPQEEHCILRGHIALLESSSQLNAVHRTPMEVVSTKI